MEEPMKRIISVITLAIIATSLYSCKSMMGGGDQIHYDKYRSYAGDGGYKNPGYLEAKKDFPQLYSATLDGALDEVQAAYERYLQLQHEVDNNKNPSQEEKVERVKDAKRLIYHAKKIYRWGFKAKRGVEAPKKEGKEPFFPKDYKWPMYLTKQMEREVGFDLTKDQYEAKISIPDMISYANSVIDNLRKPTQGCGARSVRVKETMSGGKWVTTVDFSAKRMPDKWFLDENCETWNKAGKNLPAKASRYNNRLKKYCRSVGAQKVFFKGWINRTDTIRPKRWGFVKCVIKGNKVWH